MSKVKFGTGGVLFTWAIGIAQEGLATVQADPMNPIGWAQLAVGGVVGGVAWYLVSNGYIDMKLKAGLRS
jgi:hypothetical protein